MTEVHGITEPRIYTPPLRKLTPDTSLGFAMCDFARDILHIDLYPWQRWLLIHAFEIVGSFQGSWHFRFRTVLTLVARQNGKTSLSKVIAAFFLFALCVRLVIGTSTNLEAAEEVWEGVVDIAQESPDLSGYVERVYRSAGNKTLALTGGGRYKVATANRRGGRGKSGDLVLLDELREHQTWDAYDAVSNTTMARPNGIVWCISNAGDASSCVLRFLRTQAHMALGDPDGICADYADERDMEPDDTLGIFEWSCAPETDCMSVDAWAQANPALGYGLLTLRALKSASKKPHASFLTENLCQWVTTRHDSMFPEGAWEAGIDASSRIAEDSPVVYGVDVSADRQHASIAVVGLRADGDYHGELIAYRGGLGWLQDAFQRLATNAQPGHTVRIAAQGRGAPVSAMLDIVGAVDGIEIVRCEGRDVAGWCGLLWDAVCACSDGGDEDVTPLRHIKQPRLDLAAQTAMARKMGDGAWAWDRAGSEEDASPIVALTMAFGAFVAPGKREEPSAYEDHDLMFI